ncbi:MAG: glycoside hydrolase family 1 protein [Solobacterium sp.]|nr:glycoside hydrolase family 1 protein [Solobacterium sp.]
MEEKFLLGAASAGHQVEGYNTNSDIWAQEQMKHGGYPVKSGIACDHYRRWKEDIDLLKGAGLNAYRFSLEWARIEPEEGVFDKEATEHYREVLQYCRDNGIEPVLTLVHFSCPVWLIKKGGWEADTTVEYFRRYAEYVCTQYKDLLHYICTLNEANMGYLINLYMAMAKQQAGGALQIGMDIEAMAREEEERKAENIQVFGCEEPAVFVSPRTDHGNQVIMNAHIAAVKMIHEIIPDAKAGITLSVRDIQWADGCEEKARKAWEAEFLQFMPAVQAGDFVGIQNYTRCVIGENGELPPEEGREVTEMGYEYYPEGLEHVLRTVHKDYKGDILITENGIGTLDDSRRVEFIRTAVDGVRSCRRDGIPVIGYCYWTLMDNYEWQSAYSMHFGLIGVDRETMERHPRESLYFLGKQQIR